MFFQSFLYTVEHGRFEVQETSENIRVIQEKFKIKIIILYFTK